MAITITNNNKLKRRFLVVPTEKTFDPVVKGDPVADAWAVGSTYGLGAPVYHHKTWFLSLQNGNTGHEPGAPATDWRSWWKVDLQKGAHWDYARDPMGREIPSEVVLGPGSLFLNAAFYYDAALRELPVQGGGNGQFDPQHGNYVDGWDDLGRAGRIRFTAETYLTDRALRHPPGVTLSGGWMHRRQFPAIEADAANWTAADALADTDYLIRGIYRDGSNSNSNFGTGIDNLVLKCNQACGAVWWAASEYSAMRRVRVLDCGDSGLFGIRVAKSSDNFTLEDVHVLGNGTPVANVWPGTGIFFDSSAHSASVKRIHGQALSYLMRARGLRASKIEGLEAEDCNIAFANYHAPDGPGFAGYRGAAGLVIEGFRPRGNSAGSQVAIEIAYRKSALPAAPGDVFKLVGWSDENAGSDAPRYLDLIDLDDPDPLNTGRTQVDLLGTDKGGAIEFSLREYLA